MLNEIVIHPEMESVIPKNVHKQVTSEEKIQDPMLEIHSSINCQ